MLSHDDNTIPVFACMEITLNHRWTLIIEYIRWTWRERMKQFFIINADVKLEMVKWDGNKEERTMCMRRVWRWIDSDTHWNWRAIQIGVEQSLIGISHIIDFMCLLTVSYFSSSILLLLLLFGIVLYFIFLSSDSECDDSRWTCNIQSRNVLVDRRIR